jgi:hypothetical protein
MAAMSAQESALRSNRSTRFNDRHIIPVLCDYTTLAIIGGVPVPEVRNSVQFQVDLALGQGASS